MGRLVDIASAGADVGMRPTSKHGVVFLAVADAGIRAEIIPRLAEHYHVFEAAEAKTAIAAIREQQPDMVIAEASTISDVFELVRQIKTEPDLRTIPVMVIADESQTATPSAALQQVDDLVFREAGTTALCARVRANVELGRLRAITRAQQQLVDRTREEIITRLLAAEEVERARLARELHDGIGQTLVACRLLLPQLRTNVPPSAAAALGSLERLTSDIARDLHRVAVTLRPTALDDLGLSAALEGYLDEWSASTGITMTSHFGGLEHRPGIVVETTVYRIVQEVLANVAKHTQAKNVALVAEQANGQLSIIVEDDGAGFDVEAELAAKPGAWGIAAMRERASLIGGDLKIESVPGQGTSVYLRVPTGAKS